MKKIKSIVANQFSISNISGYFEKSVTKFGNGAKIDAPKEHLGKKVIVIVVD